MTGRQVVFDSETTGLSADNDRIVELGAVEIVDFLPTGRTFHAYINPQRYVPEVVVKIHGLTYDFLKKHPTMRRVMPKFLEFVGADPMVAHNASFDVKMINAELKRLELPPLQNKIIDTLPLSKKAKPGGLHNLDVMSKHFGVDTSKRDKHGALLDSEILAQVYLHLNGGRQFGIELKPEVEEVVEAVVTAVSSRRLTTRITPEEAEAHKAFVAELGVKAIWGRYNSGGEGADLH